MTEPVATHPAQVCVIVPQSHHEGHYVDWCKTHQQPASLCMNNVFPILEGGGDRSLEQIAARLADTIVNATTTKYYDTSHQSDERIKRLLLEFAREIKRGVIEP